jgi:serine/threonine protein kinase
VEILRGIDHRRIVRLFGACLTPPRMALIQEYVQGGSLHEVLHGGAVHVQFS